MDAGLWVTLAVFAVAAAIVWQAGSRLALYADMIADRTGLGQAVIGVLLLAGVTSLPEVATSFTAGLSDNAPLAVNNLLGSISMQIALLAVADQVFHRRALTSVVPDPVVMLQGSLNVILLTLTALVITVGDVPFIGAGVGSLLLLLLSVWGFVLITRESDQQQGWVPREEPELTRDDIPGASDDKDNTELSNRALTWRTVLAAVAILVAGAAVAISGESLAEQTGLGDSYTGMVLVAIATSLPEVSTVFAAIRRHLYTLAIADIFGTNILNVALISGVDLVAPGAPVLDRVGQFSAVAALLGVVMTGIFLAGLAERRDRTVSRMGVDSALVLLAYAGGLVLLYFFR